MNFRTLLAFLLSLCAVGWVMPCGAAERQLPSCAAGWICDGYWVAAQDVGDKGSFFDAQGRPVLAKNISVSNALTANRDIYVRPWPAAWERERFILHSGNTFVVAEIKDLRARSRDVQRWVRLQFPVKASKASMPVHAEQMDNGGQAQGPSPSNIENGIWWEYPVAEVTSGYDADKNQTIITSYNLTVIGPSTADVKIENILRTCIETSGATAYQAFVDAPSPEIGARIGAAWTAFHGTLPVCLSPQNVAADLVSKFELGYIKRARWEPGLNLQFNVRSPSAENFRTIHAMIRDKLPQPLNDALSFYATTQEIPQVNVKLAPPPWAREVISTLPSTDRAIKYFDAANKLSESEDKGAALVQYAEEAITNPQVAQDYAKDAQSSLKVFQLTGDVAQAAIKQAPDIGKTLVPIEEGGKVIMREAQNAVSSAATRAGEGVRDCVNHPNECRKNAPVPGADPEGAVDKCIAHPDAVECAKKVFPSITW